jgi:hypothetical protein
MPHLTWQPIGAVYGNRLPLSLTPHCDGLNPALMMLGRSGPGDPTCIELQLVVDGDLTFQFVDLSFPHLRYEEVPSLFIQPFSNRKPSAIHPPFSSLLIAAQTQIHYAIRTLRLRPHFEYAPINTKATFSAKRMDPMMRGADARLGHALMPR